MLDAIVKETDKNPDSAIIWLHGLGADGSDFVDIIPELELPKDLKIRFIFPHAPVMPVTINNDYKMRAWYNISDMDLSKDPDVQGIKNNSPFVREFIDAEIAKGIDSKRIILIGFSQGGVMALHVAPRYEKPLAGAVSLSSYCPTTDSLDAEGSSANQNIPLFFGHGNFDNVVPIKLGKAAYDFFKSHNNPIEMHSYDMMHSVCKEEIMDLSKWIVKLI